MDGLGAPKVFTVTCVLVLVLSRQAAFSADFTYTRDSSRIWKCKIITCDVYLTLDRSSGANEQVERGIYARGALPGGSEKLESARQAHTKKGLNQPKLGSESAGAELRAAHQRS